MLIRRIAGCTHKFGAPDSWDREKDGVCSDLPVRVTGAYFESAWEPTPKELAVLNAGGSIILRVVGHQPVVALYVEPQE